MRNSGTPIDLVRWMIRRRSHLCFVSPTIRAVFEYPLLRQRRGVAVHGGSVVTATLKHLNGKGERIGIHPSQQTKYLARLFSDLPTA